VIGDWFGLQEVRLDGKLGVRFEFLVLGAVKVNCSELFRIWLVLNVGLGSGLIHKHIVKQVAYG
jgi:hypothetical protein